MENLIKLHNTPLASDRMSCLSATANQVRLVLHTTAFWLMHGVRIAIKALTRGEFATIRERLIKIGARVIEHIARIRVRLPTSCPAATLFRTHCARPHAVAHKLRGHVPR
jgi:Transposase DDE domain group 1